jgi:polysaccharide deacetylase 2 family uncharacterized protein YibQ
MAKRKTKSRKNSKKNSFLLYIIWALSAFIVIVAIFIAGYYTGYKSAENETLQLQKKQKQKLSALKEKLEVTNQLKNTYKMQARLKEVLKEDTKTYSSASHEIEDANLANPPKAIPSHQKVYTKRPKLAIIIDDTSTASQVRAIKSLHIPLTMSFLPPSKARPHSAELASKEPFYMVHLPMEALHFSAEEPLTMRVGDSQSDILERVKKMKQLFPRVHYINNHTGSKFTSDEAAMNKLIYAFNKNHILFVDSRTTAQTKAPQVLKHYGMKYVSRDIFLDHHSDKAYIKEQIKKAVALAKKRGHAIAIGHPHKTTLEALYESRDLLKQVDLVQINQIY